MRAHRYLMAGLFAAALSATKGFAVDRYVDCTTGMDTNPGTSASPWLTIQKASSSSGSLDVVHVSGGPCVLENTTFKSNLSGRPGGNCLLNESDCTVFNSYPATTDIEPPTMSTNPDGFIIDSINGPVENLKFDGFQFVPNGAAVFDEPFRNRNGSTSLLFVKRVVVDGHHKAGLKIFGGATDSHDIRFQRVFAFSTYGNGFLVQSTGAGFAYFQGPESSMQSPND